MSRRNESSHNPTSAKHNFGNNYSEHYVYSGTFPQSFITNVENPLIGYPKLQHLHKLKADQNLKYAHKPFGARVAKSQLAKFFEKHSSLVFDVVMIGSCISSDQPKLQQLLDLPIGSITARPSVLFLWVSSQMLDQGRLAIEHWGFRRSEDIVYFCLDEDCIHMPRHDGALLKKSTWHCLMGLKGTLRRSEDTDLINCNVDTDLVFDNEQSRSYPGIVPESIYSIIENFCLMSRRVHIVPSQTTGDKPVRARPGWLIVSPDIYLNNFSMNSYQEEQNKLPPGNKVILTSEIEQLRPKTPPPTPGRERSSTKKNTNRN